MGLVSYPYHIQELADNKTALEPCEAVARGRGEWGGSGRRGLGREGNSKVGVRGVGGRERRDGTSL